MSLCLFGLVAAPASAASTAADCEDLSLGEILRVTPGVDFVGTSGNDIICGTPGDDVINGGGGNDIIYGLDGNDTITTGSGNDTIYGGAGNDTITSGAGADFIDGGAGDDTIKSGDGNDTIRSGDGDDEIDAGSGNDIVFAEAGDDNVDGEAGNDQIHLGDGDDYADGGSGADKLWGGDGSDSLIGGSGDDWVSGGDGDDMIKLDSGDDYAHGGAGSDLLFGGKGEDALNGGSGSDSLNGGSGADSVNGGTQEGNDKDYCAKDKLDTQKNCFYDSKGPRLISVAVISGARIDTSKSAQIVTVRARVKDSGSGVAQFDLQFGDRNLGFSHSSRWGCDAGRPSNLEANSSEGCLISGNHFDGVYELRTLIPKYTVPGTYVLTNVGLSDFSGNGSNYDDGQLRKKKLAVNFKQVGAGDGKGPTLSSISLLTKSVNTAYSSRVVAIRVAVKDGLSGVNAIGLNFQRIIKGVSLNDNDSPYLSFSTIEQFLAPCENGGAEAPTFGPTACRVSGNSKSQVIEMKILLPRYSPSGTYRLVSVGLSDIAGNHSGMSFKKLKDKKMAVNFKQTGAGDSSGPTLKKVTIITPKIDTGAASQTVTMRFQVKDNFSGVKSFGFQLARLSGSSSKPIGTILGGNFQGLTSVWSKEADAYIDVPEGDCNPDKTHAGNPTENGAAICRISGTAKDGLYEIKFIVPAHAAAGQYRLSNFSATDFANNEKYLSWTDLKKLKLNIGFKNG